MINGDVAAAEPKRAFRFTLDCYRLTQPKLNLIEKINFHQQPDSCDLYSLDVSLLSEIVSNLDHY